jgi:hypothetical protein
MIFRDLGWERDGAELVVEDRVGVRGSGLAMPEFVVRWQFAPGTQVERVGECRYRVGRRGVTIEVQVSPDWAEVICVTSQAQVAQADAEFPLAGSVSPAFRQVTWAPYLKLVARPRGDKPCVFATTFLASAHSGT